LEKQSNFNNNAYDDNAIKLTGLYNGFGTSMVLLTGMLVGGGV
jgi:hypothetical protein